MATDLPYSRFGTLYAVGNTGKAFAAQIEAEAYARKNPALPDAMTWWQLSKYGLCGVERSVDGVVSKVLGSRMPVFSDAADESTSSRGNSFAPPSKWPARGQWITLDPHQITADRSTG
jgi:hypothetical protein